MLSLTGQKFEFATLQDRCMVINVKHWHNTEGEGELAHFEFA